MVKFCFLGSSLIRILCNYSLFYVKKVTDLKKAVSLTKTIQNSNRPYMVKFREGDLFSFNQNLSDTVNKRSLTRKMVPITGRASASFSSLQKL